QAQVWARLVHDSLDGLCQRSGKFVAASRLRAAARIEAAPGRRPFPKDWGSDSQARPRGRLILLRRTDAPGGVEWLGPRFEADPPWPHRLARAEVDLDANRIRRFALRRREPRHRPQPRGVSYTPPRRRFQERT